MRSDGSFDHITIAVDTPITNGEVFLFNRALLKLSSQRKMSIIVLSDYDHPTRVSVESVNDTGAGRTTDPAEMIKVIGQGGR